MKSLIIGEKYECFIDDEDYERISSIKWVFFKGYAKMLKPPFTMMHRVILKAKVGDQIDHIDRNKLNNTKANLRFCTNRQNCINKSGGAKVNNPFKGVRWKPEKQKFVATMQVDGKKIHLGYFDNPISAAKRYDSAVREHYGEFAFTNFSK